MFLTQLFFRRSVFLKTKRQKAEITFLKVVHPDKLERFGFKNSSIVDNDNRDDPVISEIDVYLAKTLENQIYVLQVIYLYLYN